MRERVYYSLERGGVQSFGASFVLPAGAIAFADQHAFEAAVAKVRDKVAAVPLDERRRQAVRAIAAACDAAVEPLTAEYSQAERATWPKQEGEARAVLDGDLAASDAPFLMVLTGGVYQGVRPLAEKIVGKAETLAEAAAQLISVRKNAAAAVASAQTADEVDAALAAMRASLSELARIATAA